MEHIYSELKGKTALITGSAKRIGRAIALALAGYGVNIIIHYNESENEADELVKILENKNVKAWKYKSNLNEIKDNDKSIAELCTKTGHIDILINSASIYNKNKISKVKLDELYENIKINAFAPFILSRNFANQNIDRGIIINFLDTSVEYYDSNHVAYNISKKVFHELTKIMSIEFAPKIIVNAIAPGLILPPKGKDESYLIKLRKNNLLNSTGSIEDITNSVLFLLTNKFITGQILYVDGGSHLKGMIYEPQTG
jgi:NAD(P)-dependent dehydrogenase (short-subunit alcohol dehydrogenase family)